ncbi:hypothetical protein HXX76_006194 [Chlamydomonas incerta]|uniref:Lipoprotein n=1 Tax=Chlamydomonas incerta TaxID=51695 RepID=A0A835T3H6_CHLIN|nr:hypothetical protein HXX76_006194 [Chlamydomonas incerta]|eukprot:KAG2436666.1 hypothetical protein HXX76_006194 [Chlamydomonas incerta]
MARSKQALVALAIFALAPGCASNPAYVASLDDVAANGSPNAKFEVMAAYYNAQCGKYEALNMTSPEGKAACRADTANRCYVVPNTGRTCTSSWGAQLALDNLLCPGTAAYRDQQCYVKLKDECVQDPNCGWGDIAYFGGVAQRDRLTPVAEAAAGGPITWIMCRSKEYLDFIMVNGTSINATARTEWGTKIATGNPDDDADWLAKVGNCTYAITSRAGRKYSQACSAANNLVSPSGTTYIDPADYNSTRSCIAAGCFLNWLDGVKTRARGGNVTDVFYQCSVSPNYYYNLRYPSRFDRPLTDAYNTCGLGTGYDRARCEGARLQGFPPTAA